MARQIGTTPVHPSPQKLSLSNWARFSSGTILAPHKALRSRGLSSWTTSAPAGGAQAGVAHRPVVLFVKDEAAECKEPLGTSCAGDLLVGPPRALIQGIPDDNPVRLLGQGSNIGQRLASYIWCGLLTRS